MWGGDKKAQPEPKKTKKSAEKVQNPQVESHRTPEHYRCTPRKRQSLGNDKASETAKPRKRRSSPSTAEDVAANRNTMAG